MSIKTIGAIILLSIFLAACASRPVQTEHILSDSSIVLRQHEIKDVPFLKQNAHHCGPSTLAMTLNYWGNNVSSEEVARLVYTPGMKGSLQTDMISAARRLGYMAVPIEGLSALLSEVAHDHPVIVFENLALTWLPQWHYAVVYGFDLNQETVIMHSGPEQAKHWSLQKFERSWMLADYWGLVVLKPGELAASAGEFANASAASALESLGLIDEAEQSYQAILRRWPESLVALIGMGNVEYKKGRPHEALNYFRKATEAHPFSGAARYNYVVLENSLKKKVSVQ